MVVDNKHIIIITLLIHHLPPSRYQFSRRSAAKPIG